MVVQHALRHGNRLGGLGIESAHLQGHWSGVPHSLRFPPVLVAMLGVGAADNIGNGGARLELVGCSLWVCIRFVPEASSIEGCRRTSSVAARQTCLADKPCSGSGGSGDGGFRRIDGGACGLKRHGGSGEKAFPSVVMISDNSERGLP